MSIHHVTPHAVEGQTHCEICNKGFMYYWDNKQETKGRSDITTKRNGKIVHYACVGGKSLQQLNEERKQLVK